MELVDQWISLFLLITDWIFRFLNQFTFQKSEIWKLIEGPFYEIFIFNKKRDRLVNLNRATLNKEDMISCHVDNNK